MLEHAGSLPGSGCGAGSELKGVMVKLGEPPLGLLCLQMALLQIGGL